MQLYPNYPRISQESVGGVKVRALQPKCAKFESQSTITDLRPHHTI